MENKCSFPDSRQESYQRSSVLWQNGELNKKARKFVKANASVKGKKTLLQQHFATGLMKCYFLILSLSQVILEECLSPLHCVGCITLISK